MPHSNPFRLPETYSLFGEPLYAQPIGLWLPVNVEERERKILELSRDREKALQEYLEVPDDPVKLLWYARKTEILGNFTEAVIAYTQGMRKWPKDARFPRFRGHRFALLRRLDLAIMDLNLAVDLIQGQPDEAEDYASGGPSRDKLGVASFHWNIYYHLGFSHFASGNFDEAVEAYTKCMEIATEPESRIATKHWLYMPLIRLTRWKEAAKLIENVEPNEAFIEVGDYYETLLMYKGTTTPEDLLELARSRGRFIVKGQAVANLYMAKGELGKAEEVYSEVLSSGEWTGGVSLIAEAELIRLGSKK